MIHRFIRVLAINFGNRVKISALTEFLYVFKFSLIGILSLAVFGIWHVAIGEFTVGIFEICVMVCSVLNLFLFRVHQNIELTKTTIVTLLYVMLSFLLIDGGAGNTGILWFYTFPAITFSLIGVKRTIPAMIALFGMIALVFFGKFLGIVNTPFTYFTLHQLAITLFVLTILIYLYTRRTEQDRLTVKLHTKELIDANQKLLQQISLRQESEKILLQKNEEEQTTKKAMLNLLDDLNEEKKIIESEKAKAQAFIESVGDGLVATDAQGTITVVNEAFTRILGWEKHEVVGKMLSDIVPMYDLDGQMTPTDMRPCHKVLRNGESLKLDQLFYGSKSGLKIPIRLTVTPVKHNDAKIGIIAVFADISHELENLDRLRRFELAVREASDQIVMTDPEGITIYANKVLEKITGFTPEEAIGKKAGTIWGRMMDRAYYETLWDTIRNRKEVFVGQLKNKKKNGDIYDAELHISPILDSHGQVAFFVAIERDITKQKTVERMKDEFISLVSHQLRTPLTAIRWFLEMMIKGDAGDLTPEQKDFVYNINESNKRMIDLVNTLLDISRIELGRISVEPVVTDLKAFLEGIRKDCTLFLENKEQILTMSIPDDLKPFPFDPALMRQVCMNILTNANKYSSQKTTITINVSSDDAHVFIDIKDEGLGIAKEDQTKLFTKFFRAENAKLLDPNGNGLGLYLVKQVMDASQGEITLDSDVGSGTTFHLKLPIQGPEEISGEVHLGS